MLALREDHEALMEVIKYHMVVGQSDGEDLLNGRQLHTRASDKKVTIMKYHSVSSWQYLKCCSVSSWQYLKCRSVSR